MSDQLILTCWFHKRLAILLSNFHDNSLIQVDKQERIRSDKLFWKYDTIL